MWAAPRRAGETSPSSQACETSGLTMSAILSFRSVIRAIVFDFDGLILDTEEPIYRSWLEVYQAHGEDLPFERWVQIVGSTTAGFPPQHHLEERDRKSTRLNSSHLVISYAVFCLKKKKTQT